MIKQTTLGSVVETHGIGLHTAVPVHVRLVPAPPDTGYVFRRTDLGGFEIPATVESVAHCGYATTLMRTGVMLSTVEHLLAALRGLGVEVATKYGETPMVVKLHDSTSVPGLGRVGIAVPASQCTARQIE